MSCCDEIAECLVDAIYVARASDFVSDAGEFNYGSPFKVPAHIEVDKSLMNQTEGSELVTRHVVIVTQEIKMSDRIWFSDSCDPCEAREPKAVQRFTDPTTCETSHFEVIV